MLPIEASVEAGYISMAAVVVEASMEYSRDFHGKPSSVEDRVDRLYMRATFTIFTEDSATSMIS